ncbi:uncharacterized protein LOC124153082 [Haliotis rufescens]|uniref:uncharacterized protein LOC124153082 n=1 Tax=Haliotis rufescens TaxID=6454 RepID=UPI00201F80F9|nr:uncharacterized protein LOC124153082 [Haliotis rufescens]
MACSTLFGVSLLASFIALGLGVSVTLEAEAFAGKLDENRTIYRSNAGNVRNVLLFMGESIDMTFCLGSDDNVLIENLYYSNDGTEDVFSLELDGKLIGSVTGYDSTDFGNNWNSISASGKVGETIDLASGEHTLRVFVEAQDESKDDGYGVELDRIVLDVAYNSDLSCPESTSANTDSPTTVTEETSTTYLKESSTTNAEDTTEAETTTASEGDY